jgi:hypothetical protein
VGAARLRRLSVSGAAYLWKVVSARARDGRSSIALTVYRDGRKLAPLTITFETWDDPVVGNPLNSGWRIPDAIGEVQPLSLHHPRIVAELIGAALAAGWSPETARRALRIDDGLALLSQLGYPIDSLRPSRDGAR